MPPKGFSKRDHQIRRKHAVKVSGGASLYSNVAISYAKEADTYKELFDRHRANRLRAAKRRGKSAASKQTCIDTHVVTSVTSEKRGLKPTAPSNSKAEVVPEPADAAAESRTPAQVVPVSPPVAQKAAAPNKPTKRRSTPVEEDVLPTPKRLRTDALVVVVTDAANLAAVLDSIRK